MGYCVSDIISKCGVGLVIYQILCQIPEGGALSLMNGRASKPCLCCRAKLFIFQPACCLEAALAIWQGAVRKNHQQSWSDRTTAHFPGHVQSQCHALNALKH